MQKSRINWSLLLGLALFFLSALFAVAGLEGGKVRNQFYQAFSSGDLAKIDQAIAASKAAGGSLGRAFEGALLMKKADLVKGAGQKLKTFKAGHELFEKELSENQENVEYRFIRLCVQENAPKIVKYRSEIESDKTFVVANFGSLNPETQKYVREYAQRSEVLKLSELK
jgi:hypothetical protein